MVCTTKWKYVLAIIICEYLVFYAVLRDFYGFYGNIGNLSKIDETQKDAKYVL